MSYRLLATAVAVAACSLSACQKGSDDHAARAPVTDAYRTDIEHLCGVLTLSGADQRPPEERGYLTAQWLGDNLTTEQGRDFLVTFQQAPDKAKALRAEATRVGLAKCALAESWK